MNVTGISVGTSQNTSLNQQLHYQVEPRTFTVLKSGGEPNQYLVEGIVTVIGREWSDEKNFKRIKFKQI